MEHVQNMATRMIKEVEMNFYEERLKKFSIFGIEKIGGDLRVLKGYLTEDHDLQSFSPEHRTQNHGFQL